ncbi:hypothetical protein ACFLUZ_05815 [Chloroflexota bacterium]
MCKRCDGDYVVGEGGTLECNKCGHIAGDISLLLAEKPFEYPDDKVPEKYISKLPEDLFKPT